MPEEGANRRGIQQTQKVARRRTRRTQRHSGIWPDCTSLLHRHLTTWQSYLALWRQLISHEHDEWTDTGRSRCWTAVTKCRLWTHLECLERLHVYIYSMMEARLVSQDTTDIHNVCFSFASVPRTNEIGEDRLELCQGEGGQALCRPPWAGRCCTWATTENTIMHPADTWVANEYTSVEQWWQLSGVRFLISGQWSVVGNAWMVCIWLHELVYP